MAYMAYMLQATWLHGLHGCKLAIYMFAPQQPGGPKGPADMVCVFGGRHLKSRRFAQTKHHFTARQAIQRIQPN